MQRYKKKREDMNDTCVKFKIRMTKSLYKSDIISVVTKSTKDAFQTYFNIFLMSVGKNISFLSYKANNLLPLALVLRKNLNTV